MSGFDADRVYSVSVHDVPEPTAPESPSQIEKLLLEFLLQYRVGGEFIYRYFPLLIVYFIFLPLQLQTGTSYALIFY